MAGYPSCDDINVVVLALVALDFGVENVKEVMTWGRFDGLCGDD